jgi:diguanylate cyclase (GGDEF)-like protein
VLGTFALYQGHPGLPDDRIAALIARASHLVGIAVDRQELLARLAHQARHDALTGLPNRPALLDQLTASLSRAAAAGEPGPVVVFLDLDRLKIVNDSLGHELGDELLVCTAERLASAVPAHAMVARFGGDEFVVVDDRADADSAAALTTAVLAAVAEPVVLEERLLTPSASAGVVVATPGQSAVEVLRDADIAMYRAKHRGGAGYALFDADMRRRAFDRLDLEAQLRTGLAAGEFRLHFQPVVDLTRDGAVVGFEALVRWQHPQRGLLGPDSFIALAEETGLIVPLGEWVLRTAAATVGGWGEHHDLRGLTLAVNLAAQQLAVPGLVATVQQCMATIAPATLALELTESTVMAETALDRGVIDELAAAGAALSIDDFGTGYSSLSYLSRLPVRTLKIDRSFVADLGRRPEAASIAAAVVSLADQLGLLVVAEGIETTGQRDLLAAMGCRYGQGFLFGRPAPADDAAGLLG